MGVNSTNELYESILCIFKTIVEFSNVMKNTTLMVPRIAVVYAIQIATAVQDLVRMSV